MIRSDFHLHTNASDGTETRHQLIKIALQNNVKYMSITDHDTMINTSDERIGDLRLIRGCELSAKDGKTGRRVHILCYDPEDTKELEEYFEYMRSERLRVGRKYLENIADRFPVIDMEDLEPYMNLSGTVFKSYIMQAIMTYGYAAEVYGDLYRELFGKGTPNGVIRAEYGDVRDVARIARRSGGLCSVAHPSVYRSMDVTKELLDAEAVDAVEVWHPRNTEEDKAVLQEWCKEKGLIMTGGTDYHGMLSSVPCVPGMTGPDEENLRKILERLGIRD